MKLLNPLVKLIWYYHVSDWFAYVNWNQFPLQTEFHFVGSLDHIVRLPICNTLKLNNYTERSTYAHAQIVKQRNAGRFCFFLSPNKIHRDCFLNLNSLVLISMPVVVYRFCSHWTIQFNRFKKKHLNIQIYIYVCVCTKRARYWTKNKKLLLNDYNRRWWAHKIQFSCSFSIRHSTVNWLYKCMYVSIIYMYNCTLHNCMRCIAVHWCFGIILNGFNEYFNSKAIVRKKGNDNERGGKHLQWPYISDKLFISLRWTHRIFYVPIAWQQNVMSGAKIKAEIKRSTIDPYFS